MLLLSLIILLAPIAVGQLPATPECADARGCRQLALEAAASQDYERFHDLAWRAMQKAPKPDPDLMYLLARAQALSGRPGDALVMLSRLADMRVPTDAATNEDFRRVRALKGWLELQGRLEAMTAPRDAPTLVAPKGDIATAAVEEALRFSPSGLVPGGLAYDGVSRRFIVADQRGRKLAVVDEFSRHVATLAGAQAGFGDVEAMEIDPREGNLWVVSDGSDAATKLHKLQLISGRVLKTYQLPAEFAPAHLVDVAVGQDGAILVLDAAGGRVFHLASSGALELAAEVAGEPPASIAPAQPGVAYVAQATSIVRIDLRTKTVTVLKTLDGIDTSSIARLRWSRGDLVAIQKTGDGYRAARLTLDSAGRRITGLDVLDPGFATRDPAAATLVGGTLYHLVDGDGLEVAVRRIKLKQP